MPAARLTPVMVVLAILFGLAAVFLPLEVLEVVGVPLVVAGAFFGGIRVGLLTALWAMLCASVAYFVLSNADATDYVVSVVGYLVVGISVGIAVDRFRGQRARLEDTMSAQEAAQNQLRASQRRYRLLFESSNDAVTLHGLDHQGEPTRFVEVNDAACSRLGYTREELLGLTPRAVDAALRPGQLREISARLLREDRVIYESARKTRDGEIIPVEVSASLTEVDGEHMVLSIDRDISGRKKQERHLVKLSLQDELTGLLNRRGFFVMLPETAKRAKRSGIPVIVLYADLDGLKVINDTRGHARGDMALVAVADALRATFRETDIMARIGGDEFCVVAEAEIPADSSTLSERLDAALASAGAAIGEHLAMSYGAVATGWQGLDDADELLTRADMLMYQTKRARRR